MPASPHNAMRRRNHRLKKLNFFVQMIAARNSGKNPINAEPLGDWIDQLSAMPAPKTAAARNKRHSRSSSRYSSSDQTMNANSSSSNISPEQFVAWSQNVSCKPQTATARNGGSHALQIVKNEKLLRSRSRCASVRFCGRMATDRASRPSASEAHTAENTFNATGICAAGSQWNG